MFANDWASPCLLVNACSNAIMKTLWGKHPAIRAWKDGGQNNNLLFPGLTSGHACTQYNKGLLTKRHGKRSMGVEIWMRGIQHDSKHKRGNNSSIELTPWSQAQAKLGCLIQNKWGGLVFWEGSYKWICQILTIVSRLTCTNGHLWDRRYAMITMMLNVRPWRWGGGDEICQSITIGWLTHCHWNTANTYRNPGVQCVRFGPYGFSLALLLFVGIFSLLASFFNFSNLFLQDWEGFLAFCLVHNCRSQDMSEDHTFNRHVWDFLYCGESMWLQDYNPSFAD